MPGLNYRPGIRAFSLLELVISIAVLSIGITVILQALSFSAQATGLSFDIAEAVFLAEDKIQELGFKEKQGQVREESVADRNGKFEWAYETNLDPGLNLYRVELKIAWPRLNRKEGLDLNTYLR